MGKIKVLLIEDEITLAKIIKDTLESVGFDVCLAYDGDEGLKLFFESKPDVLISDIMMPKISGLDVVQRIRKTDQTTPVIFEGTNSTHKSSDRTYFFKRGIGTAYI